MPHKRSRTIDEKIEECLEMIGNLHPSKKEEMRKALLNNTNVVNNVSKSKAFLSKMFGLPEQGKYTKNYWLSRGWNNVEASYKIENLENKTERKSPFSREYWLDKINPETNEKYTIEEADFARNAYRPIRKEYWLAKGFTEKDAEQKAIEQKKENDKKGAKKSKERSILDIRATSKRCKEYWCNIGYSEKEAEEKVSKIQSTFSLDKCVEKYGKEKGHKIWLKRQQQWQKNYKKSNFSKVSQDLFWCIADKLDTLENIFFAQLSKEKTKDLTGINNEYKLVLDRIIRPDFIDTNKKKIIEFDGVYWHGEKGRGNKKREEERENILCEHGYKVLRVCEKDYKKNKEDVVDRCLNFLTQ